MAILINGLAYAKKLRAGLKAEVAEMTARGKTPTLAVVLAGDDPASARYVRNKEKDCERLGIIGETIRLPADVTQAEMVSLIESLNNREDIDGILVQHPAPPQIDEKALYNLIRPDKDVDAFHPINVGRIMTGDYDMLPCTPAGVMALLEEYNIPVEGRECVVVGRSNIVGKPMSMLFTHANGTSTICHSRTKDLAEVTRRADILVVAIGKAKYITADMVKENAVVFDVGINLDADGNMVGDVDFDAVSQKCAYITPVPGGLGPVTRVMLMKNTINASRLALRVSKKSEDFFE